ncbi:DUF4185 domain-containing protein [Gordonia sp. CPCC 206044]|uniref:DUF4185 domain-containing protein n=1 Tax=Gordonia sp. CPCC 206044 TaxID=3140793 RepID=UPI003AF37907
MVRRRSRVVRLALAGVLAVGASALAMTHGAGLADAAPCSNGGTGSSLLDSGSLSTGSLGSGSAGSSGSSGWGSSDRPGLGPQGPLPIYLGANTRTVSWVTGPRSPNRTFSRFGISGTDLGISWDNGSGQTLMAFGDTFGNCNVVGQQWRHNVLLRTDDTDLRNGVRVPNGVAGDVTSGTVIASGQPNYAQELIPSLGISQVEVTTIPTAAMSLPWGAGHRQFINYMSVRSWGAPGHWVTNFSAIAYSDNNGQTWTTDQNTILVNANTPITVGLPFGLPPATANNGKFQQNAYVRGKPGSDEAQYVYQFGTPNGRFGAAFLCRFKPADVLNLADYEYWNGKTWVDDIANMGDLEAAVVPAPVTELSVAWSPYLSKYVMVDGDNEIVLRTADHPQGPWSAPRTLVRPGAVVLYGPMMLPQSPALTGTGKDLYINASRWSDYNVMLLHTDLSKVRR